MNFYLKTLVVAALVLGNAAAQDDLIHSDVPLFAYDAENAWPRHFSDETSFGCAHNVKLGDWEYVEEDEIASWYRLQNYGVMHCFLIVGEAYDEHELAEVGGEPSLLIGIGEAGAGSSKTRLWALQIGGRPGSDYLLLSSEVSEQPILSFAVLERDCPQENVRMGPDLDILNTRYCAINSQQDLLALTKAMAKRPPLGTLRFFKEVE
ncbi:MAG: hypothetical protein AAFX54_02830 [Pseudomonadota bacterium]